MAFHGGYDRDDFGEPTADALLGALMMAESQHHQLQLLELVAKWAEGWGKSKRARKR